MNEVGSIEDIVVCPIDCSSVFQGVNAEKVYTPGEFSVETQIPSEENPS